MIHKDHVRLIQEGVGDGKVWAELGSGTGAFTLALRDCVGEDIELYSIDKNESRLDKQKETVGLLFPGTKIHFIKQDFTDQLDLPQLDGILAANALHFVNDKVALLRTLRTFLKPQGRLLVVEYNVDRGNSWVPYPFSYTTFQDLSESAGFKETRLLTKIYASKLKRKK